MRLPDPLRLVLAVASLELLLAGVSGGPQAPVEVARALVGALLVGLGGLLPGRWGYAARWVLPGMLIGGVALPVLGLDPRTFLAWGLVIAAGLVWALGGDRGRALSPRGAVILLILPYLAAWTIPTVLENRVPDSAVMVWAASAAIACVVLQHWSLILVLFVTGQPVSTEAWAANPPADPATAARPDVVIVTVDTLRLDEAPSLRSFQGGVSLSAQAAAPWTLPSLASLMTGLQPHHHGAVRTASSMEPVPTSIETLAERLAAAGYDTAVSAETPFIDPDFGLDQGFARVRRPWTWHHVLPRGPFGTRTRPFLGTLAAAAGLAPPLPWGATERADDALELLAARRDRPIFLWVHFFDAHLPYRHAMELDLPLSTRMFISRGTLKALGDHPAPEVVALLRPARVLELQKIDAAILRIRAALRPGTLLVLTSDHGEEFGEHGGFEHGHSFYQELLAMPMVLDGFPAIPAETLATHADVAPTVLATLGLATSGLDGINLAAPGGPERRPLGSVNPLYGELEQRAVRLADQKLIERDGEQISFELRDDPGELQPRPAGELRALVPWLPPFPDREGNAPMDPDVAARLKELGYIED